MLVVTDADREADGAVALHGGAEDHLVRGSIPDGSAPAGGPLRVAQRRLRRDLSTTDELTGLPNLRGFAPIAEHHLRMADRSQDPGRVPVRASRRTGDGRERRARRGRRASRARRPRCCSKPSATLDVPARITDGHVRRAAHRRRRGRRDPRPVPPGRSHRGARHGPRGAAFDLSLSVGSALYEPEQPATLAQILETAGRRLASNIPQGGHPTADALRIPRDRTPASRARSRQGDRCGQEDVVAGQERVDGDDRHLRGARPRPAAQRLRDRDEDAFRGLFARYAPTAKALAQRVVRQSHLAEEIVQEAFMAVWRNPEGYDAERGSVKSWLMGMVHHRAVDLVRREESHRRRAEASIPEAMQDVPTTPTRSCTQLGLPEERRIVRAALDELPAEQRDVLTLMYFEGLSQSQIAERTGLPLGTVKSRTLLGMRRMRGVARRDRTMTRDHTTIEELLAVQALGGLDGDDLEALASEQRDPRRLRGLPRGSRPTSPRPRAGSRSRSIRCPVDPAMADRILWNPYRSLRRLRAGRGPDVDDLSHHRERQEPDRALAGAVASRPWSRCSFVAVTVLRPEHGPPRRPAPRPPRRSFRFEGSRRGRARGGVHAR